MKTHEYAVILKFKINFHDLQAKPIQNFIVKTIPVPHFEESQTVNMIRVCDATLYFDSSHCSLPSVTRLRTRAQQQVLSIVHRDFVHSTGGGGRRLRSTLLYSLKNIPRTTQGVRKQPFELTSFTDDKRRVESKFNWQQRTPP